jgi:hypothetical protein
MPRDADYGRELAKRLSALYSGRITNVEFTYDAFLELDDGVWVDDWLDSWDATIKQLREVKLFDRHVPLSIDIDERYDNNMFHNNRRLVTQAAIHYGNVEVR